LAARQLAEIAFDADSLTWEKLRLASIKADSQQA
jgi:hypothetical protein